MGEVETFLSNHSRIRRRIDREGSKGLCALSGDLAKAGIKVSPDELRLHIRVFDIHSYAVEALKDVYCNRDAMRILMEKLSTSKK